MIPHEVKSRRALLSQSIAAGVCRVCRCTAEWACDRGCRWVELDLCSTCSLAIESVACWRQYCYRPNWAELRREVNRLKKAHDACSTCYAVVRALADWQQRAYRPNWTALGREVERLTAQPPKALEAGPGWKGCCYR